MTVEWTHLNGLVQLPRLQGEEERRSTWRQAMATLSALVTNRQRPVPLEGFDPDALLDGTTVALRAGLLDDLSWLSPPAAAAALYELAAALPPGEVKRELGRRVLTRLHTGNAASFVALATQLALGSRRTLGGAAVRARVALALDLPLGLGARADALALALISRRELARDWLTGPATGSLPARRLAARLLERAAREAARRATLGDDGGTRVFETEQVRDAWNRLLADRESLVWRHVATARGLLASTVPDLGETIELHTDPSLTPTEWRRAAASWAAFVAIDPDRAIPRCEQLLRSPVAERDRGLAGAMMLGLPRAAEAQPAEASRLLDRLVREGGLDAAEALVHLRRERLGDDFGRRAAEVARAGLRRELADEPPEDDGRVALIEALLEELDEKPGTPASLHAEVAWALDAFAERDATEAHRRARDVLGSVEDRVRALESLPPDGPDARRASFRALRDLDATLFATDTLVNLLTLGTRDGTAVALRSMADAFERVTNWLVLREYDPITGPVPHFTLRLHRLRTLLHLVDADGGQIDDRADLLRRRRLLTTQVLLNRVRSDAASPLRRATCAATARSCDALVREEVAEVSDVLLLAAAHVSDPEDLATLSEASMVPEIEAVMHAYGGLQRTVASAPRSARGVRAALDGLETVAQALPVATSPRVEALRRTLNALGAALESVVAAPSLEALRPGSDAGRLPPLEGAVQTLAELCVGAARRFGGADRMEAPSSGAALRLLDRCVERALRGDTDAIGEALASAAESLQADLPAPIAELVLLTLERLWQLPLQSEEGTDDAYRPSGERQAALPPWMPPSRTLGGFYVLRALGSGAGGSVFVARRVQERHDRSAERFALKVPEYDGTAARTLSEDEFMRMFREEASALLVLPHHPNLARFVTFDAGARPKPILVMELVEGPSMERLLQMGELDMGTALHILDGVAAGLEAMHAAGVGHLDVKPGNVILREPPAEHGLPARSAADLRAASPVLVDFGLAGRHVRPGCATAHYGAPEIWGASAGTDPRPADVYAFACLAYETLAGGNLFDGPHEMALITAHLSHDGMPPALAALAERPEARPVAEALSAALRQDPAHRCTITALRGALAALAPRLATATWPL
ncbi:MAG: protein kinase domain-containing protein [Myxococcota bacterium]